MQLTDYPVIIGGDPFNQFRCLYKKELFWKLHDPEYCLSVMMAAYESGARAFDLSFPENVDLFLELERRVQEAPVAFGNPTWLQGVSLNGRMLQYSRDRVIKTLVLRHFPGPISDLVRGDLAESAPLVFGYDESVPILTDVEIASITLDEQAFRERLRGLSVARFLMLGGTDADWLSALGRMDIIAQMVRIAKDMGFVPLLLGHYTSTLIPAAMKASLEVQGYVVPLNREWSWFTHEDALRAVRQADKPCIAFMPLGSGSLVSDVRGALRWLYDEAGVTGILVGVSRPQTARETVKLCLELAPCGN